MKAHELLNEIANRISPTALEYWNGLESADEYVVEAQQHGIDSAVELVEAMAK